MIISLFSPINLFFSVERVEFIDLVEFELALSKCSERLMFIVARIPEQMDISRKPISVFLLRKKICVFCLFGNGGTHEGT